VIEKTAFSTDYRRLFEEIVRDGRF